MPPRSKNSNNPPPRAVIQTLKKKPYAFVPLPNDFEALEPVWHDGSSSQGRLSGEVRFEMTTLSPLLVGWERKPLADLGLPLPGVPLDKPTLSPLRAPWGERPVLIPGDSLKGLLRHELGALLGAPMERVAERSYSYRPNLQFPDDPNRRAYLEPRLARVKSSKKTPIENDEYSIPLVVDVLPLLSWNKPKYHTSNEPGKYLPGPHVEPYRGGIGGGQRIEPLHTRVTDDGTTERTKIRDLLDVEKKPHEHKDIGFEPDVIEQYKVTLRHLFHAEVGHFSPRHPQLGEDRMATRKEIVNAVHQATQNAFKPGDLIWVEWDTEKKCIVSFGWHYYYRWAYQDTVRLRGSKEKRRGLFPTEDELRLVDTMVPEKLTLVRRLFGYTGDNDGSKDIGRGHHSQLMGRVSINAAIEDVRNGEGEGSRFLQPTFLRELGLPKPSAVEHYVQQQRDHVRVRRNDDAMLMTYGDAKGYDKSGELAGRKFYLDRQGATAEDASARNKSNKRSTLAVEASKSGRTFRFTLRFRDLDKRELVAVLLALCPDQFKSILPSDNHEYCSKLGYARPLGWGSVQVRAKEMYFLDGDPSTLRAKEPATWFREHQALLRANGLRRWLEMHRRNHPDAGDYPTLTANGPVYEYHTQLRAEHARRRRFRKE